MGILQTEEAFRQEHLQEEIFHEPVGNTSRISIVDPDLMRRNQMARMLYEAGHSPEIYDGFEEFIEAGMRPGIVLVHVGSRPEDDTFSAHLLRARALATIVGYGPKRCTRDVARMATQGFHIYLDFPMTNDSFVNVIGDLLQDQEKSRANTASIADACERCGRLTAREEAVVLQLVNGKSIKQSAYELSVSETSVSQHRHNAYRKLGARNAAEATRIVMMGGYVKTRKFAAG